MYYTLDESDGLPSNYVYRVFEDSKGYIWIATEDGAARYDGHTMKVYNTSNGLANNDVYKIFEDDCDRIWFLTMSSDLNYLKDDSLYTVKTGCKFRMSDLWADQSRTSFATESRAVGKYLTVPCDYPASKSISGETGYGPSTVPLSARRFLVHGQGGCQLVDENNNVLSESKTPIIRSSVNQSANEVGVYNMLDRRGLIIANILEDSLYEISFDKEITSLSDQLIVQWNPLSKTFQITNNGYILLYDGKARFVDRSKLPVITSTAVASYFRDNGENLWVSTNEGVRIYPAVSRRWEVSKLNNQNLDKQPRFAKVVSDGDRLDFITETASLYTYSIKAKTMSSVHKTSNRKNSIYAARLTNDILWYSSQLDGLVQLDRSRPMEYRRLELPAMDPLCKDKDLLPNDRVKDFDISSNGSLAYGGIRFGVWYYKDLKYLTFGKQDVSSVAFSGKDIWFSKSDQVLVYRNIEDCTHETIKIPFGNCDFIHTGKGRVLIANQEGHLMECHDTDCDTIATLEGGSVVKAVEMDTATLLSTKTHMYRYTQSPSGPRIESIFDYSILGRNVVVQDFVLVDSTIYYATNKGLLKSTYKEPLTPNLELQLYLDSHKEGAYTYAHDHAPIDVRFSTSYVHPFEAVIYEYKLEGSSSKYTQIQDRLVTFPKLAKGKYTFLLQARKPNGKVLDKVSFEIKVKPPWWNTLWFYFLSFVLFLGSILLLFRYYVLRLKKRAAINTQFAELELNALQSQMSPHFMFNTMNSLQYLVASGKTDEADKYISKFATVLRKYLEISRSKFVPLVEEIAVTTLYLELETLRFGDRFSFSIDNELSQKEYNHLVPATLIQPFVENALVHGLFHKKGSGRIEIKLYSIGDYIHIDIIDNGIGRVEAETRKKQRSVVHESRGQEIIEDRLALIKKLDNFQITYSITDLYDEKVSLGTKVSIVIKSNVKYEGSYS